MAMNWADSSDDEDEDFFAPENNPPVPGIAPEPEEEEYFPEEPEPKQRKEFILPEHPPFTAFIGNLAFSIKDPEELADKISQLVKTRFGTDIVITAQRVAFDRNNGNQHKGFGYVEVQTLEHLKAVLELDDGQSMIAGRPIHLDVAQAPSRGGQSSGRSNSFGGQQQSSRSNSFGPDGGAGGVDGSKFQGGRHNKQGGGGSFRRQDSAGGERQQQRSGSFRREDSAGSERQQGGGSFRRQDSASGGRRDDNNSNAGGGERQGGGGSFKVASTGERPSLKLQPRSQATDGAGGSNTATSIFGGAKPRDNDTWERERSANKEQPQKEGGEKRGSHRGSGRGGAGRDGGGRAGSPGREGGRGGRAAGRDSGRPGAAGKDSGRAGSPGKEGGRAGGRGRNDRKPSRQSSTGSRGADGNKNDKKVEPKKAEPKKAAPQPVVAAVEPEATAPGAKKVFNKFSALDFGDSDDE